MPRGSAADFFTPASKKRRVGSEKGAGKAKAKAKDKGNAKGKAKASKAKDNGGPAEETFAIKRIQSRLVADPVVAEYAPYSSSRQAYGALATKFEDGYLYTLEWEGKDPKTKRAYV
jgi:hypothetical protein